MNSEDINFPAYRKYKNNKSYFRFSSPTQFEQIQLIGSKKMIHLVEAKLYAEKMYVNDMLYNFSEMAEVITEQEYLLLKNSDNN